MKRIKLSMLDINLLSEEQKEELILNGFSTKISDTPKDNKKTAIVILGATALPLAKRTARAIELYKKGYADYIILSGGEGWKRNANEEVLKRRIEVVREVIPDTSQYTDKAISEMTEAEFMELMTYYAGVPDEAIIWEHNSTNTKENMQNVNIILDTPLARKKLNIERLILVTDLPYARRTLLTAEASRKYNDIELCVSPTNTNIRKEIIQGEVERLVKYSKNGNLRDATIEISDNGKIKVLEEKEKEREEIE